MYSLMSMPHHGALVVEEKLGEGARQLGLPHPGGAEEDERADRPVGVAEPGAAAAHRVGDRGDRVVLADDALVQPLLHAQELLHLALEHPADRDPGPAGDDLGDVVLVDLLLEQGPVALAACAAAAPPRRAGARARRAGRSAARRRGEVGHQLGALGVVAQLLDLLLDGARSRRGRPSPAASARAAPARPPGGWPARAPVPRGARARARRSPCAAPRARSRAGGSRARRCRARSACESISMRSREAASSTRSIALSGRKRSVM